MLESLKPLKPMEPMEIQMISLKEAENLLTTSSSLDEIPGLGDTIIGDPQSLVGILLQHGFAGSNLEMLYLGNAMAHQGFRVLIPLLQGHGTNAEDLAHYSADSWLAKYEQAYHYLVGEKEGRKIIAIGHSMGGALSLYFASRLSFIGVVSIAGPIRYSRFQRVAVRFVRFLPLTLFYETFYFHDKRLLKHPGITYFIEQYGRIKLKSIHEVFELLEHTYKALPNITVPTCLIHAKKDHTVPSSHVTIIRKQIGTLNLEVHWLTRSDHVAVIDTDRNIVIEKILGFINRILPK